MQERVQEKAQETSPATSDATARRKRKRAHGFELDRKRVERKDGESALSHALRVRVRRSLLRSGKRLRPSLNRVLGHYSKIGDAGWLDASGFDWVPALERSTEAIRKEAEQVLQRRATLQPLHQLSPDHSRIDPGDGKWKVYFLKGYGFWVDEHCARCPETARAVRRIPGVESAFFSILEARKRIPHHRGPTRAIFTAHLGLILPRDRDNCWIKVGPTWGHWDEGKVICFDDTYKHRVRNDTDEDRVVLLLHIRRPLRFPGNLLGRLAFGALKWSPFVQDGLRNQKRWEERLARDEGARR